MLDLAKGEKKRKGGGERGETSTIGVLVSGRSSQYNVEIKMSPRIEKEASFQISDKDAEKDADLLDSNPNSEKTLAADSISERMFTKGLGGEGGGKKEKK